MNNTTTSSIILALKILKKENSTSEAIQVLEDALKQSMKLHIMDMAAMGSVISMDEIEEEFKNGLKLLNIYNAGGE